MIPRTPDGYIQWYELLETSGLSEFQMKLAWYSSIMKVQTVELGHKRTLEATLVLWV